MSVIDTPEGREALIAVLTDTQQDAALLLPLLDNVEHFDAHDPDLPGKPFSSEPLNWTADYFSAQLYCARKNLSLIRVKHLIEVRLRLQSIKHQGFIPAKSSEIPVSANTELACASAKQLRRFIIQGDLHLIRTALALELNQNQLDRQDLHAAIQWTEAHVPALFLPYEVKAFAREIDTLAGHWSVDYYNDQTVSLNTNYSRERLLHLIEVREHLRQQGADGFVPIIPRPKRSAESAPTPTPTPTNVSRTATLKEGKQIGLLSPALRAALLVGGALAALVVFIVSLVK